MSPQTHQTHQTQNPYFVLGFPAFSIGNCFSMGENLCSRTRALFSALFVLFIVSVLNLFAFSFCHFLFVAFVYGRFTCMRSALPGHLGRVSSEWAEVWIMESMFQISKAFDFHDSRISWMCIPRFWLLEPSFRPKLLQHPLIVFQKTDETQKLEHVRPHFRTNKHAKFNSPCYLKYVSDSGLICSTKDFVSMRKYVAVRLIIGRFCIHRSGANNWLGRWAGGK